MSLVMAWLLTATLAAATVTLHGVVLGLVVRFGLHEAVGRGGSNLGATGMIPMMLALLAAHTAEIWIYAARMYAVVPALGIGGLEGPAFSGGLRDHLYYSAVNYTSLGYGDISPTGEMRLVATFEALVGLLMIGWSSAFAFLMMQRHRSDRADG